METHGPDEIGKSDTMVLNIAGTQILRFDLICRICGNENDKNVNIYGPDGVGNDLSLKINTYLPIKVCEDDNLPLSCCYTCTSTILTWHELVLNSVETDRKLREMPVVISNQENEESVKNEPESILPSECYSIGETGDPSASLTVFYQPKKATRDLETNLINETPIVENSEIQQFLPPVEQEEVVPREEEKPECKDSYNFACDYCGSLFVTDEEILKHVREEHSSKLNLAEVQNAPIESSTEKKKARKHTKIDQEAVNSAKVVVNGKVYYNCKLCGKSLYSPYTYLWHMRIHTGERPFNCELCGKQFRVSQGLARHLRETHQGIKNFGCDLCGRMFSTRRNVEEHRRIHTNERPYVCDLCGKAFKQKASLFVHNRSHNDHFPFRCSYCDQGFRTKPPLLVHVTRHTGERPYPCEVCGRCFRIKYELKRHMLVHSDDKPFSCAECGLSFRQKRYLRNHNKINHNRTTD